MASHDMNFAFQVAPVGEGPDHVLYRQVVEDAQYGQKLGFEAAWLLEHHFSDYYPTPSPLLHMAHIAAACPGLGLGTSVLVLPWYHPLRLAGEISMLNALTDGTLHLGIGRGTAKMEYDAFGVDMNEARSRFAEVYKIVELGLKGEHFTFHGKHFNIDRPVQVRPAPSGKKVNFYGAIGSMASAEIMADLGLPPLCLAQFPDHLLRRILETWRSKTEAAGRPTEGVNLPISIKLFIGDTDEQAREIGRKYYPAFFDLQARHYSVDEDPWVGIPEYEAFRKMFANLKQLANPENLGPFMNVNLVGSPETIIKRIAALRDVGFNYVLVSSAPPGVPQSLRQETLQRFATEVAPHFSNRFKAKEALRAAG